MSGYLFELEKKTEGNGEDEDADDIILPFSVAVRKDLILKKKDEKEEAEK